jgi:hypothetical protein
MVLSPTPSFPGAWPDLSSTDIVPPLPDKPIPQDTLINDETPQDISPSLLCLSPRPIAELPSLSSSLSTADSSVTSRSPTPEQSCSPLEVQPTCTPSQTHLPVVLDLREPRSPDSAHFSPPDDVSSLPSPSSSRLHLSLSNNCPGTQSLESVATCLPSLSMPSTPDAEHGEREDEESHSDHPPEEISNPRSYGDRQEHSPHAAKVSVGKRTFLGKVKRFGGRVKKLFKPTVVETRPRRSSVSSHVTPRKPPLTVNVCLPAGVPESPTSRQNSSVPSLLPRRLSLHSLLHSRLPLGSSDSNSRATADNRLPTILSTQDDDWLSPLDSHYSDAAAADVRGINHSEPQADKDDRAEDQVPAVLHGLGIGAPEPNSVANRDSA